MFPLHNNKNTITLSTETIKPFHIQEFERNTLNENAVINNKSKKFHKSQNTKDELFLCESSSFDKIFVCEDDIYDEIVLYGGK